MEFKRIESAQHRWRALSRAPTSSLSSEQERPSGMGSSSNGPTTKINKEVASNQHKTHQIQRS